MMMMKALTTGFFLLVVAFQKVQAEEEEARNVMDHLEQHWNENLTNIIVGTPADISEIPYMAGIFTDGQQGCGAAIVNSRMVISAAHCFEQSADKSFQVGVGKDHLDAFTSFYDVSYIIRYPRYYDVDQGKDVALLILRTPIRMIANRVQPIPLVNAASYSELPVNDQGLVSGWGNTRPWGRPSDQLLKTSVTIVSNEYARRTGLGRLSPDTFAAGEPGKRGKGLRRDTCQGDSGGPLAWNGKLMGITSYGNGCGGKSPGVYAHVQPFNLWVNRMNSLVQSGTTSTYRRVLGEWTFSGARGGKQSHFMSLWVKLPSFAKTITFRLEPLPGTPRDADLDLYVKHQGTGAINQMGTYDCTADSYESDEECRFANPGESRFAVKIEHYSRTIRTRLVMEVAMRGGRSMSTRQMTQDFSDLSFQGTKYLVVPSVQGSQVQVQGSFSNPQVKVTLTTLYGSNEESVCSMDGDSGNLVEPCRFDATGQEFGTLIKLSAPQPRQRRRRRRRRNNTPPTTGSLRVTYTGFDHASSPSPMNEMISTGNNNRLSIPLGDLVKFDGDVGKTLVVELSEFSGTKLSKISVEFDGVEEWNCNKWGMEQNHALEYCNGAIPGWAWEEASVVIHGRGVGARLQVKLMDI